MFRAEIEHALDITPTDCSLLKELKENMQRNLGHRIPVTSGSSYVSLDPSQRNVSAVQNFFAARGITAVDLLMQLLGRYVTDEFLWFIFLFIGVISVNTSKSWPVTPLNAAAAGRIHPAPAK